MAPHKANPTAYFHRAPAEVQFIMRLVRRRLARGWTMKRTARAVGVSLGTIQRWATEMNCRRRTRSAPAQLRRRAEELIRAGALGNLAIARQLRCRPGTIIKWRRAVYRSEEADEATDEGPTEERIEGPRRLRKQRRCPECGQLLYLWPCLVCFPPNAQRTQNVQ
jgi:transposase-like protein